MPVYNRLDVGAPLPAGNYMPLSAFSCPVPAGLVGAWFMANGLEIARTNVVTGADAWMQGDVSVVDGAARIGDRAFMDTGLPETQAASVLLICRKSVPTGSIGFFGNYLGGFSSGLGLFSSAGGSGTISVSVQKTTGQITAGIGADLLNWAMVAVSVPATGQVRVHNLTAGTAGNHADAEARAAPNASSMWIGGFPSEGGSFRDSADLALALYWNRNLSDAEIGDVGAWARAYAASRGIMA